METVAFTLAGEAALEERCSLPWVYRIWFYGTLSVEKIRIYLGILVDLIPEAVIVSKYGQPKSLRGGNYRYQADKV